MNLFARRPAKAAVRSMLDRFRRGQDPGQTAHPNRALAGIGAEPGAGDPGVDCPSRRGLRRAQGGSAPAPGLRWGLYPQRAADQAAWYAPWPARLALWGHPRHRGLAAIADVRRHQQAWLALEPGRYPAALADLRARLGASPGGRPERDEALGCVAAQSLRALGRDPFDTQLLCAQLLLDDTLAEMATGEGKTLAVGLAAAVAALSGSPVHVMTANDYLAARDAQSIEPLIRALGLRVGCVQAASTPQQRRQAYDADITYCTAREVAFDSLRDSLAVRSAPGSAPLSSGHGPAASGLPGFDSSTELGARAALLAGGFRAGGRQEASAGAAPRASPADGAPADVLPPGGRVLRGLCHALVDEADSLLIDEAVMPLVLGETVDDAAQRALSFQALALARQVSLDDDVWLDRAQRSVHWTPAGLERLDDRAAGLGGEWVHRQHRQDLVAQALVALHVLAAGRDYLVRDGAVELVDPVTGRTAPGRVWSRGLHRLVELKEGCKPSPDTHTAAQTSYQRFFARYWRLGGTSGTLAEGRAELAAIYGRPVVAVPLRLPSQRVTLPARRFETDFEREQAVLARVIELRALQRPVLIGVASVTAAQRLSSRLSEGGIRHRVLDASQAADEALTVAEAGQAGAVTVATAMAGRGTDIELGPGVAERGGLHVLLLQDNPCARGERQFLGRAARQGDPGSAEVWHALDADRWASHRWARALARPPFFPMQAASRLQQRFHGWTARRARRRLLEQDLSWQRKLAFHTLHV